MDRVSAKRRLESPCGYFDAFEDATSTRLGDGSEYRGDARETTRGERCAAWSDAENAEDELSDEVGAEDEDGNKCRNGRRGHPLRHAPVVLRERVDGEWGYCDVQGADEDGDAFGAASGVSSSDENGVGDVDVDAARPYRFYDRLTPLIRENSPSSQHNPLLEQTNSPTAYSLIYDEKEVYGGKLFDDVRVHVEPSGKLKSFVSAPHGGAVRLRRSRGARRPFSDAECDSHQREARRRCDSALVADVPLVSLGVYAREFTRSRRGWGRPPLGGRFGVFVAVSALVGRGACTTR